MPIQTDLRKMLLMKNDGRQAEGIIRVRCVRYTTVTVYFDNNR